MFIGRTNELKRLQALLSGDNYRCALIYGRRRVGKTELIKHALRSQKDSVIIHCECKKVLASINLELLESEIKTCLHWKEYIHFQGFDDLFDAIFQASEKQKIILVLDEFSYLPIGGENGIDASLARVIDLRKNEKCHLKLIISGSSVDLLLKMIDRNSPMHGRFDSIEEIKEFDYYDAAKFVPDYSDEDKFTTYAVFGGLPYALSLVNPSLSIKENIQNLFFENNSVLPMLCQDIIESESVKVESLNSILMLIAKGKQKYSDIMAVLGKDKRQEYALNKGIQLNLIRKSVPINDSNNKKQTYYEFNDNLLCFYFRYVLPDSSSSHLMGKELFYETRLKDSLNQQYLPHVFESVSREFLIRRNKKGLVTPPFFQIGTYRYNNAKEKLNLQFDVVTEDKDGFTSYECKYTNALIDVSILKEEEKQTNLSPLRIYRLGYISKSGFEKDVIANQSNCYSLKDFYDTRLDD